MKIFLVYKIGGDYDKSHVERLVKQIKQHNKCEISILTDVPREIMGVADWTYQLQNDWPGWWSKMELFRFPGPLLFLDLDSTVLGPLDNLWKAAQNHGLLLLEDFYFPSELQSSVMGWNGNLREIYDCFTVDAEEMVARRKRRWSDQSYIEMLCLEMQRPVTRWQDVLPAGEVCSYKVHVKNGIVPKGNKLVCFHGKPRPWAVPELQGNEFGA